MDGHEVARRARLPADTLAGLRSMERGGENSELTIELAAALAKTGALVSSVGLPELRALLEAAGMPTHPVDKLTAPD